MKLKILGILISMSIILAACNTISNMPLTKQTGDGIKIQSLTDIQATVKMFSAYVIMPENVIYVIAEKKALSELNQVTIPSLKSGYNRILEIVLWDENSKMVDRIACIFDNKNNKPIKINSQTTLSADILKLLIKNPGEFRNYIQFIAPELLDEIISQLLKKDVLPVLIDNDRIAQAVLYSLKQLKAEGNLNSSTNINLSPFEVGKIESNQIFNVFKEKNLIFNKTNSGEYKGDLPVIKADDIAPRILFLSPSAAYPGDSVFIKGRNFTPLNPIVNGDKIDLKIGGEQTTPLRIYSDGVLDIIEIKLPYVTKGEIKLTVPGRGQTTGQLDIRDLTIDTSTPESESESEPEPTPEPSFNPWPSGSPPPMY